MERLLVPVECLFNWLALVLLKWNHMLVVSATRRSLVSVRPRAEKFNIVSNDYRRSHKCDFSIFDRKWPFWANLVKKIKIASLSWNSVPRLVRICRTHWRCSVFLFLTRNSLRANQVQKFKIVQNKIWYLTQFEYSKCNGGVNFVFFKL